jgi:glycosyltransferase involved in cell wall biosynthesis
VIVKAAPGTPENERESSYGDFRVIEFGSSAPDLPYVRNYFKNERLYSRLERFLGSFIRAESIELIHAQHVLTSVPSVAAAAQSGIPSVCTVRDYWPVCYWSDLIHTADDAALCPACSGSMMTQCIRPRAGGLWPLALPMIPYMRGNLARKRTGLAGAGAVIAVSSTIAADLKARAPELTETRIVVIPNPVNISDLSARAEASQPPVDGPYALYLGKLAPNKGTSHLVRVVEDAGLDWPLLIAGDGPERGAIESAARQSSRDIRMLGWVDQNQTAALLKHAGMLIFPSRGPESLSRVLIEASALAVPIAAMNTGGTPDVVDDENTGLLSQTPAELAQDVRRLRHDESLRSRLGAAAKFRAEARFDSPAVVAQVEQLYLQLLGRTA